MRRLTALLFLLAGIEVFGGCAIVHRYPAYRGKVLELGTDQPIEKAGVLAIYNTETASPAGWVGDYLGCQAVLTNPKGKFEIPAKFYFTFKPLGRFDPTPFITIYKRGYGNFPGSFAEHLPKHGKTEPELDTDWLPPWEEVTFWLPKLETAEEIRNHDRNMPHPLPLIRPGVKFPPPGMTVEQFGYYGY